jgi:hypothetical protein
MGGRDLNPDLNPLGCNQRFHFVMSLHITSIPPCQASPGAATAAPLRLRHAGPAAQLSVRSVRPKIECETDGNGLIGNSSDRASRPLWQTEAVEPSLLSFDVDGRLQASAGISLLEASQLLRFDEGRFVPVGHDEFEATWPRVTPAFGRLLCWMNFAAGAEMLAKGVCLCRHVEVRFPKDVPDYPSGDIHIWAAAVHAGKPSATTTVSTISYGTLGNLLDTNYHKLKLGPAFPRLFATIKGSEQEQNLVFAAYYVLAKTIRNRDAHAYRPKVRDNHFWLVPDLFVEALNILVSWLPGGAKAAATWLATAEQYIESL